MITSILYHPSHKTKIKRKVGSWHTCTLSLCPLQREMCWYMCNRNILHLPSYSNSLPASPLPIPHFIFSDFLSLHSALLFDCRGIASAATWFIYLLFFVWAPQPVLELQLFCKSAHGHCPILLLLPWSSQFPSWLLPCVGTFTKLSSCLLSFLSFFKNFFIILFSRGCWNPKLLKSDRKRCQEAKPAMIL